MTSQHSEYPETGIPAVLAGIGHQISGLADTLWAARSGDELMNTVAEIEALKTTLDAIELQAVRELDATNAVKPVGWASTQDFVTAIAGGHKGTGPAARQTRARCRPAADDRRRRRRCATGGSPPRKRR